MDHPQNGSRPRRPKLDSLLRMVERPDYPGLTELLSLHLESHECRGEGTATQSARTTLEPTSRFPPTRVHM